MTCPNCLSPTHFEVIITVRGVSRDGLQCKYCGNIWSPEAIENIPQINSSKSIGDIGINVANR